MIKNSYSAKFIVFEGLDGAGKTTQIKKLWNHCRQNGTKIYTTVEPTQFLTGGLIRANLQHEWRTSSECTQLLFAADRDQHLHKEVFIQLENGINVVSDRYFYSSLAYGAVDCDMDWLISINNLFVVPDLVIFLDVPPDVCAERIQKERDSLQLFEKVEILEKVRQNYQKVIDRFADIHRIEIINANQSEDQVFEIVKSLMVGLS